MSESDLKTRFGSIPSHGLEFKLTPCHQTCVIVTFVLKLCLLKTIAENEKFSASESCWGCRNQEDAFSARASSAITSRSGESNRMTAHNRLIPVIATPLSYGPETSSWWRDGRGCSAPGSP